MIKNERASPGDGSLRQRKDGTWEYRVSIGMDANGKRIAKSFYSKDKSGALAKKKYREWLSNQQVGIEAVKQWAEVWLETYKKNKVAPKSYANYKLYVEHHIIPEIGDLKLDDVRPVHIEQIYLTKAGLSASALNHIKIALNGIFETAIDNRLCTTNPAKKPRPPKKTSKAPEAFTKDEVTKLLAFASTHQCGAYVEALLYTGMRIGELCALLWSDIDLENMIVSVNKAIATVDLDGEKYDVKDTTKTGKPREVVLTDSGASVFKSAPKKGLYVFTGKSGSFCTPDEYRKRYDKVFHDLGESVRHLSPHKCRHTYASHFLAGGANIRAVQDQLGHARITTTEIYTHVDIDSRKENVAKLTY